MTSPRFALSAMILATGISALLFTFDRPESRSSTASTTMAAVADSDGQTEQTSSASDCCGGNNTPVDPAEVERRGAEQAAHEALFNKFDNWAERYARAHLDERENLLAEGVTLARERRVIMGDLIKANPREALEIADRLSPLARQELPLEVAAEVEKLVSARGDLEVLGVTTKGGNSYRRYATIGNDRYAV